DVGEITARCTAAPTISLITPSSGPVAGGQAYKITGNHFCDRAVVQFGSANSTITSISNSIINGTTPVGKAGVINVTVKNPNGKSATAASAYSYVGTPALSTNAGPTINGVAGTAVTFSGSVSGGNPPYTYLWNFGDGASATTLSATHTYSSAGTYSVTLQV